MQAILLAASGESPEPHHENALNDSHRRAVRKDLIGLKGLLAAAISGGAGRVLTGLAAVGIDPRHFNLQAGIGSTYA
jgi:hypothetical protein